MAQGKLYLYLYLVQKLEINSDAAVLLTEK
jgi:hypothetical protein